MKRLDRVLLRELLVLSVAGSLVIAFLFVANELIFIGKTYDVSRIPTLAWLQLAFLYAPDWLKFALPTGVAFAASLVTSRMTRESELNALRAAGVPIRRVFWPVFLVGTLMGLLSFYNSESVVPKAVEKRKKLIAEAAAVGTLPLFQSNVPLRLGNFDAVISGMTRNADNSLSLQDILLVETRPNHESWIYRAKAGDYRNGLWHFPEADLITVRDGMATTGNGRDLVINQVVDPDQLTGAMVVEDKTVGELRKEIANDRAAGLDVRRKESQYWALFTSPAACAIFGLLSGVLSIRLAKAGPYIGVIVSLATLATHFNFFVISNEVFARLGWLPVVAAAWLPIAFYLAATLVLSWRLE